MRKIKQTRGRAQTLRQDTGGIWKLPADTSKGTQLLQAIKGVLES